MFNFLIQLIGLSMNTTQLIVLTILAAIFAIVVILNFSFGLGWAEQKLEGVQGVGGHLVFILVAFGGVLSVSLWILVLILRKTIKIAWKALVKLADWGFDLGTDLSLLL